jgi:hypothetical protein
MERKTCPMFVDSQESGLKVEAEERIYECALGHRSSFFPLT